MLQAHMLRVIDASSLALVCESDRDQRPGRFLRLDSATLATAGAVEVALFPDGVSFLPGASL